MTARRKKTPRSMACAAKKMVVSGFSYLWATCGPLVRTNSDLKHVLSEFHHSMHRWRPLGPPWVVSFMFLISNIVLYGSRVFVGSAAPFCVSFTSRCFLATMFGICSCCFLTFIWTGAHIVKGFDKTTSVPESQLAADGGHGWRWRRTLTNLSC